MIEPGDLEIIKKEHEYYLLFLLYLNLYFFVERKYYDKYFY